MPDAPIQDVVEALFSVLDASGLDSTLGDRIYHQVADQNDQMPLMVFSLTQTSIRGSFGNVNFEYIIGVDFDIYTRLDLGSSAAATAGIVEDTLYNLLDQTELTVSGWDRAYIQFQTRNARVVDEEAMRITDSATIWCVAP